MIVWGPGHVWSNHRHHSLQLALALQGSLGVRSSPRRRWTRCGAALIEPDAFHEISGGKVNVLLTFVDPESDLGAALLENIESEITVVPNSTVAVWRQYLGDPASLTSARVEPWVRQYLLPNDGYDPRRTRPPLSFHDCRVCGIGLGLPAFWGRLRRWGPPHGDSEYRQNERRMAVLGVWRRSEEPRFANRHWR